MREAFLETFLDFASKLEMIGQTVVLRPHPAGRFTDRKGIALPPNVTVSREPLYDLDLASFAYAISAPSTILFDFALAGVPAAVWVDDEQQVDVSNFDGLSLVGPVDDWWRFSLAARFERQALVDRQEAFIANQQIPANVRERYQQLLTLS